VLGTKCECRLVPVKIGLESAPSLISKEPGDRVKTNRRDAVWSAPSTI
jgi:hypothetical protein